MKLFLSSALAVIALTSSAFAQSTDSATSNLSVTLEATVTLGSLDDISLFESSTTAGQWAGADQFCIAPSLGTYSITYSGSGAAGAFEMTDPVSSDTLQYLGLYQQLDSAGASLPASVLQPDTPLTGLTIADSVSCDPTDTTSVNSQLVVVVPSGFSVGKSAGDYAGTLTVLVAAE